MGGLVKNIAQTECRLGLWEVDDGTISGETPGVDGLNTVAKRWPCLPPGPIQNFPISEGLP